jgi:protein SCO1/2
MKPLLPRRQALQRLLGAGLGAVPAAWLAGGAAQAHEGTHLASGLRVRQQAPGALPAVNLVSMQGDSIALERALAAPVPLVLNFIFTTCSSSCSMQTAQLVQVRRQWLAQGQGLQLVSITIDPDNDTPQQLQRFAGGFGIREGWAFYTGRFDDLLAVQRHFDVYRGSKAAHPPVLLMRRSAAAPWLRLEGFADNASVIAQLRELPARG